MSNTTETNIEFTPNQIRQYIGMSQSALHDDDATVGNIDVAVAVIGKHEIGDIHRNLELVRQAFDSILDWARDYGCQLMVEDGAVVVGIDDQELDDSKD